jgi:hypothetical protein
METMMELKVSLDFACCGCSQAVSVTLQCSGAGLASGARPLAAVNVPCPTCGAVNCVEFEPGGALHAVTPYATRRLIIEPSIN